MFREIGLALEITRREARDQLRDWRIIFPVMFLTLFFPFLMNFTAQQILGFVNRYGANIIGERMVPFLLMIVGFFPISVSLVVALESFVGEKERGTIEPLLNTPLKDWQLYLGKLLAATLPPLFASFLGMAVYLSGLQLRSIPLPPAPVIFQIFTLTCVQAVLMVSGAVVISSQATSVRAANLLASFIIIPVALLIQGESVVLFWGDYTTLWWAVFGLLILTVLLVRAGMAHFQREELLGRDIDVLNLGWLWRTFRNAFTGEARTPWQWYMQEVPNALRELRTPALVVTALAIVATILGARQVDRFLVPLGQGDVHDINARLRALLAAWPLFDYHPVLNIWWQNLRAMLVAMVLGAVSFGILGVLPLLLTLGVAGYLSGLIARTGIPLVTYVVGFFLPHGVIETPAAILATAAILYTGAALATPSPGKTIGEVWMISLAHFAKIMIGAVIPLLLIAAGIEAWVTPRLAILLFGH